MGLLDGKVAIITGAGRGIGAAAAKLFAEQGASVVVSDLDKAPAEEVVGAIKKGGGKAVAVAGNVMEQSTNEALIKAALDNFKGLDILVPAAGFCNDKVIQKMELEDFRLMVRVHMEAPWMLCKLAYPHFKELSQDGNYRRVVFVASEAGTHGNAGQSNYGAAKSGAVGLMRVLTKEWLRIRVNCNCVAYGFVETRLTQSTSGQQILGANIGIPEQSRQMGEQFMMLRGGRILTPEEAAGAIFALAIPQADGVNGQLVEVDSGIGL
ncbi:MAG: SDR family oxidoreductase [Candidatus Abyssobacteria bacterium SURF_17]|uniref:SDR family oxidoreductase n=1 Tax=Candidatus Abyssobacteria bacterium SURF_17 TaxID=2093361 RepID=A0A419EZ83_9BACT|nr:MAG: SDR family oxidoreductase [Candidatus Abyssubacteria bacterium SURF_17]